MAKSDSFFIRASVDQSGNTFTQTAIDLGAYVDALGKSVLRIHNIAVRYPKPAGILTTPPYTGYCQFQVTTQSQTAIVGMDNKSLIASGTAAVHFEVSSSFPTNLNDEVDVAPQMWTNGYLVGVEQIYLGAVSDDGWDSTQGELGIILECTVETLSQSAAMALALSQQ